MEITLAQSDGVTQNSVENNQEKQKQQYLFKTINPILLNYQTNHNTYQKINMFHAVFSDLSENKLGISHQ